MTNYGGGESSALDIEFSEFSDFEKGPPERTSLEKVTHLGSLLVASSEILHKRECALFNGALGFTPNREEGDIMHLIAGYNPYGVDVEWYRGSFADSLEGYSIENGRVVSHRRTALTMPEEFPRGSYLDETTEELRDDLINISGMAADPEDSLSTVVAKLLNTYGTRTQRQTRLHWVINPIAKRTNNIDVTMDKRTCPQHALQLAPKLKIDVTQHFPDSTASSTILRLLENGVAEHEIIMAMSRRTRMPVSPFYEEVVERRNVAQARLEERQLGLQNATQGQVDKFTSKLLRMWPYIETAELGSPSLG